MHALPLCGEIEHMSIRHDASARREASAAHGRCKALRNADRRRLFRRRLCDILARPMMKKCYEPRVKAECKPAGVNRRLGALGGLFSHAVERDIIDSNPSARLR
jgi:hypothetical protein